MVNKKVETTQVGQIYYDLQESKYTKRIDNAENDDRPRFQEVKSGIVRIRPEKWMRSVPINNLCIIMDVNNKTISKATLKYLQENVRPIYIDAMLKEHIYDLYQLDEQVEYGEVAPASKAVYRELQKTLEMMEGVDASYLRITF